MTNPIYHNSPEDSPYRKNCQRAVTAYEARRRGHNVWADINRDIVDFRAFGKGWTTFYKDGSCIDCSAENGIAGMQKIIKELEKYPDGARFGVQVDWMDDIKPNSGHVFAIEKINGKAVFIDPQINKMNVENYFEHAKGENILIMRLDNLDFSDSVIEACKTY